MGLGDMLRTASTAIVRRAPAAPPLVSVAPRAKVPAPAEQKALRLSYPAQMFFGLTDDPDLRDAVSAASAYRVAWLSYACMRYRSTKLTEPPLWIREEQHGEEVWIEGDHPLAAVLERPNPDMRMPELLELLSLYLDGAGGRALLVKNRDRAGRVASLYPFAADEFTVEPAGGRLFGRFRVRTASGERDLTPDDVIFVRNIDPGNLLGGMGPVDAALAHVNIGQDLRDAVRATLRNAVRPGSVTKVATTLSDEQFATFRERFQLQYQGAMNQGKNMLLENAEFQTLARNIGDLELGPVQGDVEAAVCACFQVHPAVVGAKLGIENSGSWSDIIKSATANFYDLFAFPAWGRIEAVLTDALLREADKNPLRFIRFDKSKVRALALDVAARTAEASQAGVYWTINERRVHTGQKPLPDGDPRGGQLGFPITLPTLPADAAPVTAPAAGDAPAKAIPTAGPIEAKAVGSADPARSQAEAILRGQEAVLAALAHQQIQHDLSAVLQIVRGMKDASPAEVRRVTALAEQYLRTTAPDRWRRAMHPALLAVGQGAVERVSAATRVGFDQLQPGLTPFIEREIAQLIASVTDTTTAGVRAALAPPLAAGEGIADLATRVRSAGAFGTERAVLIAETESTRTATGAPHASLSHYGQTTGRRVFKSWRTMGDDLVRPAHRQLEGERREIDEAFSNGEQHPQAPRCRCILTFDVEDAA